MNSRRVTQTRMFCHLVIVLLYSTVSTYGQYEGDNCVKNGVHGICTNVNKCPSAIKDIINRRTPQICSYDGLDPVVCCVDNAQSPPPVATPLPLPNHTTTEYIPPLYDYDTPAAPKAECSPISPSITSVKTGQKAWDKCIEYQEQLIYPCEKTAALNGEVARGRNCFHKADELIVGGTEAAVGEFPHMVLLGYGDNITSAHWDCGGTLLNEWFILTAAHCISSLDYGLVQFAALGKLKRSDIKDNTNVHVFEKRIRHPKYKPPSRYHDIGLLKTDTQMMLGPFAVPGCLDVGKDLKYDKALATGWGAVATLGNQSDTLLKVTLSKFPDEICVDKYPMNRRRLSHGVDSSTQLCYGDFSLSKDTCQGDSGGPLQVKNQHVFCMYTIVGVTSFGGTCGSAGEPAVYTKVEPYVPWIESIVWA